MTPSTPIATPINLPIDISTIKGFLSEAEGAALYACAAALPGSAPVVEIGSYCGKSTVYLGLGCRKSQRALFAVDHHRGSEEHQPGEFFHDAELVDAQGDFDTLAAFRSTLKAAALNDTVIPVLTSSQQFGSSWQSPVAMVFVDGGHSLDAALGDYRTWAGRIEIGGKLAIHDVYPKSEDGGQAPITVYRLALASGLFKEDQAVDSLRILTRV